MAENSLTFSRDGVIGTPICKRLFRRLLLRRLRPAPAHDKWVADMRPSVQVHACEMQRAVWESSGRP